MSSVLQLSMYQIKINSYESSLNIMKSLFYLKIKWNDIVLFMNCVQPAIEYILAKSTNLVH